MKAGNDRVEMIEVSVNGKTKIDTSSGDTAGVGSDVVGLQNVSAHNDVTILTGNGADVVGLHGVTIHGMGSVLGNLSIKTGNGNDAIGLAGVHVHGKATLDAGNADLGGGDEIGVTDTTVGGLATLKTGNGQDLVGIGEVPQFLEQPLASAVDFWFERLSGAIVSGKSSAGSFDLKDRRRQRPGAVRIGGPGCVAVRRIGGQGDREISAAATMCSVSITAQVGGKLTVKGGAGFDMLDVGGNVIYPGLPAITGFEA